MEWSLVLCALSCVFAGMGMTLGAGSVMREARTRRMRRVRRDAGLAMGADAHMAEGRRAAASGWPAPAAAAAGVCGAEAAVAGAGLRDARRMRVLSAGVRTLIAPARMLLKIGVVEQQMKDAQMLLAHKGIQTTDEALTSLVLAGTLLVGLFGTVVCASVIGGVAFAMCFVACLIALCSSKKQKLEAQIRDQVPIALDLMDACFKSGYTLLQTFAYVSQETSGALREVFLGAVHRLQTGGTTAEALSVLKSSAYSRELQFIAVALDIQHQTGGSMQWVLSAAAQSLRSDIELERALRTQTTQARLSSRIVCLMPFVLIAVFSLLSEGFLEPLFTSPLGIAILLLALVMQCAGIVMVRQILRTSAQI